MTRPCFVFICTDQQRSDSLGCYGNTQVRSPNIDAITGGGMRFNRHITPMQICSPSRATMVTGLYPHTPATGQSACHGKRKDTLGRR